MPVFSFAYALFCDPEYSAAHSERFFQAQSKGQSYISYLDAYRRDSTRPFPKAVADGSQAVAKDGNRDQASGRYLPTRAMAWEVMPFIIRELTGTPPLPGEQTIPLVDGPPAPFTPAIINADRPLFSCLAAIFINQDPRFLSDTTSFLTGFQLPAASIPVLTAIGKSGAAKPSEGQIMSLTPFLVEEMTSWPAPW
jgi:hypothetical protein